MTGLAGAVWVITGGGRGIGAAIAEAAAAHGAKIAVFERDRRLGEASERRLAGMGAEARSYVVDVVDEPAVSAAVEGVRDDLGEIRTLVNNAGIARHGPSLSYTRDDFRSSLDVMVTGAFLCSRECARAMRVGGGGAIVNVSSICGVVGFPMRLAYSAAKAALHAMTRVLAAEWAGYGIRVNAVAPGVTETAMVRGVIERGLIDVDAYVARTPLGRLARPDEIADAAIYLASERAAFVTGHVLVADGGWTAQGWIPWSGDPEAPGLSPR